MKIYRIAQSLLQTQWYAPASRTRRRRDHWKNATPAIKRERERLGILPPLRLKKTILDPDFPEFPVRTASRITLNKLRRLFDDAAQGMIDQPLLDDVYSEWLEHLATYAEERAGWLKDYTEADDRDFFNEIYDKIEQHHAELVRFHSAPPREKLQALNAAIQLVHGQETLLTHYRMKHNRRVEGCDDLDFLDWLSSKDRQIGDRQPRLSTANFSIRVSSRITLQKLRQLFDDAAQGMVDRPMLDDVCSEWANFVSRGIAEMRRDIAEDERGETSIDELEDVIVRAEKAVAELEANQSSPTPRKMEALNKAIQLWHREAAFLDHYLRDYSYQEVWKFLNWLSSKDRQIGDRQPPTPVETMRSNRVRNLNSTASIREASGRRVVYHCAPQDCRSNILAQGIDHTKGKCGTDYESVGTKPGNYFWNDRKQAIYSQGNSLEGSGRPFDVWEVDVTGLNLKPDPYWKGRSTRALFTTDAISPDRVRLLAPKTAQIYRIASDITLPKLRRLFDDAAQGMIDEALLDDVASEWHQYLVDLVNSLEKGHDPIYHQQDKDPELVRRLQKVIGSLERSYPKPQDKLLALNLAIQTFHHDLRIFSHYLFDRKVRPSEDERMWYLNWLSSPTRKIGDRQAQAQAEADLNFPIRVAQKQERIRQAAILQDGVIYEGRAHCNIIQEINNVSKYKHNPENQGFVTDSGRFVDRKEAAAIALGCGQIKKLWYWKDKLDSADLNYPDGPPKPPVKTAAKARWVSVPRGLNRNTFTKRKVKYLTPEIMEVNCFECGGTGICPIGPPEVPAGSKCIDCKGRGKVLVS